VHKIRPTQAARQPAAEKAWAKWPGMQQRSKRRSQERAMHSNSAFAGGEAGNQLGMAERRSFLLLQRRHGEDETDERD